jgi:hypothetical protein
MIEQKPAEPVKKLNPFETKKEDPPALKKPVT